MSTTLSILNPQPQRLDGPSHLQDLVTNQSSGTAIEYHDFQNESINITYDELHQRAAVLASAITHQTHNDDSGNRKHFIVPLLLPQCPELYISQLAILKAGGAFCPLPLDAPQDRLRFILKDVSAAVVLTTTSLQSHFPSDLEVTIINVDEQYEKRSVTHRTATATDLAYVMYTSGSTGLPKGVLLSHNAAVQALLAHDQHIPTYSRFLQFAAPTFDVSVFEIFFTLFRGKTLVCCERTHLLSDLPGTINTLNIDAAELTPSVVSNLLGPRKSIPNLKVLLTIGEMLKKDVVDRYGGDADHEAVLHGMYGPTEATIHCTLQSNFQRNMSVQNIGITLDTVSAFVVRPDSEGLQEYPEVMPLDGEGELAIGGHQLADGYLNRDEQTKAAFQDHPQYGRLYRTGDKAKLTKDGQLLCLGRISSGQVKLRGQRLELGEVEYALTKAEGCAGAVAEVIADVLVAFCQCSPGSLTEDDVRTTCKKWLPAYMIPTEIVLQPRLPYLSSGKIDRRALRESFATSQTQRASAVEHSEGDQMKALLDVVHNVIGPSAVRGDDMSLPGIDSLTSIRVVSGLNKLGYAPPTAIQVMTARTMHELVDILADAQKTRQSTSSNASQELATQRKEAAMQHPLIQAQKDTIQAILPCSAVQAAMLSNTLHQPVSYCNWIKLAMKPSYKDKDINCAITSLIAKHELLRAGFLAGPSGFDLVVYSAGASRQVQWVQQFIHEYSKSTEPEFLEPCAFQLRRTTRAVEVLLQIHHALYDQWSIDILRHDLHRLLDGKEVQSTAFSDVIHHYMENVENGVSEDNLTFWRDTVGTAESVTFPLMNSLKRRSEQERTSWILLNVDTTHLHDISDKHHWSIPAIFQSVFAYLLSQYTGNSDITFGTVLSGRHVAVADIDHIFGPTLSTLPMRAQISRSMKWSTLVSKLHDLNRQILKHSETPMTQIKKLTTLTADEALFDTLFVWQGSTWSQDEQDVLELDSADFHEFKLAIEARPSTKGIEARVTYDSSIMPPQQAVQLLSQVAKLTAFVLEDVTQTLDKVQARLPDDLLSISNPQWQAPRYQLDLVDDLEQILNSHADLDALLIADDLTHGSEIYQRMTFKDLHKRANQVAHRLRELGVEQDDLVCICMEKSLDFYVAILGVIKSGAGYLPLVPDIQPERAAAIFDQAQIKAIIADAGLGSVTNRCQAHILTPSATDLSSYSTIPPKVESKPSHIAYTVFTSGSTGVPKGVSVTRQNLHGNLRVLRELYEHQPGDRLLQGCLQSFDVAVFEIFFSFLTGMTICTATRDVLFDDLPKAIRQFGVTHLSMTPTVASLVDPAEVPSVKFLVTAGEAMTATVHREWAGKGLHQGYGPSETTNICTITMNMSADHYLGSIGAPFSNTSAFVLDQTDDFNILPQGAYGEFAFGGEQVFRGYVGLEKLNKQKIIDHPRFGRVYRSGDMGRILADGTLFIHGRSDFQVKIRGNRVELGEINSVVLRHDAVEDCFSIAHKDERSQPVLLSFWKPQDSAHQTVEIVQPNQDVLKHNQAIYRNLESSLPSYMQPACLIPVERLPRTAQGKMDQRALRSLFESCSPEMRIQFSHSDVTDDTLGGPSPHEDLLISILSEMFGTATAEIDRRTRLDAIGLNSVNAVSLAKQLSKSLNRAIPVSLVLRNASIARLAKALDTGTQAAVEADPKVLEVFSQTIKDAILRSLSLSTDVVEHILPCTPLQEVMLAAGQTSAQAYINTTVFAIKGNLKLLRQCFRQVFDRHAILRTVFVDTQLSDRPFAQVVLRNVALPWTEKTTLTESDIEASRSSIAFNHPIDLLVGKQNGSTQLFMHLHHSVYDGTSMSILFSEIESLFRGEELASAPSPLPFLSECVKQTGADSREFWSRRLRGYKAKPFPRARTEQQSTEQRSSAVLGVSFRDIEAFTAEHRVSIASLIHAAWAQCLTLLQDADDICFGDVVSGRSPEIHGIDALVAPCFNTIPIRIDMKRSQSSTQLVQQLHQARNLSRRHQLAPLRLIQRNLAGPGARLFDSLVIIQPSADDFDDAIWQLEDENGGMGQPLILEFRPVNNTVELIIHYMKDLLGDLDVHLLPQLMQVSLQCIIQPSSNSSEDRLTLAYPNLRGVLRSIADISTSNELQGGATSSQWSSDELEVRDVLSALSKVSSNKIERNTSIYQLGLDSLNAAQIATGLRSRGFSVDIADVLERRTSAGIAQCTKSRSVNDSDHLDDLLADFDKTHRETAIKQHSIPKDAVERVWPCTPVQQGMLAQSIASSGKHYINHIWLGVDQKRMTIDFIDTSIRALQDKHPILRTGFIHDTDSKAPFFMCTHRSGSEPVVVRHENTIDHINEDGIAADIAQSLHIPPWRVCVVAQHSGMTIVLSLHHALYDATGLELLFEDLSACLRQDSIGPAYALDTVLKPMLNIDRQSHSDSEQYWHTQLRTSSFLPFPSLTPCVVKHSRVTELGRDIKMSSAELDGLCRAQRCTIQAAIQTAWAKLLSSYLGEPHVTFGIVLSNRSNDKDEKVVFPCINTLPVAIDTQPSDQDLLSSMVDFNATVQRYRSTPLSDIQRYAGRPGEALFDTVVVYQRSRDTNESTRPHAFSIDRQSAAVDYKISLELTTTVAGKVSLILSFADYILPNDHASLMLSQYEQLLSQVLGRQPSDVLSPQRTLSVTHAKQETIPSPFLMLHHTVERSAKLHPDKTAIDFIWSTDEAEEASTEFSYVEVDRAGNRVAHLLLDHTRGQHQIVAVCMNKCPEASFAFLGILKAGCAFLAMDPELPKARKEFILKDAGVKVLLTDPTLELADLDSQAVQIQLTQDALEHLPSTPYKGAKVDPQATCYCLYTSGTTGTPKGCEITHESAVQAMMAFQRLFDGHWTSTSRWLQFASYWFDVSILEHFWSWSVGITMVGAPRDLVLGDLVHFINSANITHIDLTPSLARLLDPEDVPCLCNGVFITGGEALKQEIIQRWGEFRVICNGYGPTEATIGVTMNRFIDQNAKPSNIGPAFDNVGSCVIDPETLQPVLLGAVGELCVFGKLVGKGYLNRRDLTEKAFPFLQHISKRVYRTGDLVRQLADGSFLFIGRKDSQAKLRGQRLEIDEIDEVIKSSAENISDVASLVVKSSDGNRQTLVSFLTTGSSPRDGLTLSEDKNRSTTISGTLEACKKFLPAYMVPTHVIAINKIPLTVNNKVDSKALTSFYQNLSTQQIQDMQGTSHAKQTLTADGRRILKVLQNMLPVDEHSTYNDSNIFSLGLSSVSAISFASQLKRHGFPKANMAAIMSNPQIGRLASVLSDGGQQAEESSVRQAKLAMAAFDRRFRRHAALALDVSAAMIEQVVPCSSLQQGLLLDSLRSDRHSYFNTFRFELHVQNVDKLQTAVQALGQNVEMLRTSFLETEEGHLQVILKKPMWSFLRVSDAQQDTSQLDSLRAQWLRKNSKAVVLPFQPALVRTPNGWLLVLHIHHALYDGVSFDLLMLALSQLYQGGRPEYGPTFTSILPWGPLRSELSAKKHWTDYMRSFSYRPLVRNTRYDGPDHAVVLRHDLHYSTFEQCRQALGVSHQAIVQAAFQVALKKFSNTSQSFGIVTSGRALPVDGADITLGPLFNTLPVKVMTLSSLTWAELVARCHSWSAQMLPYQHSALRDIKKWTNQSVHEELFDILFVCQISDKAQGINELWTQLHDEANAEYPLAFEAGVTSQSDIALNMVAQPAIASAGDLKHFVDTFDQALQHIIHNADKKVSDTFAIDMEACDDDYKPVSKHHADLNGVQDFEWSEEARVIREEIAKLAELPITDLDEHSTLFQAGLDSIDAVKLVSRLRKRDIDLRVSTILQAQTIPRIVQNLFKTSTAEANPPLRALTELQQDLNTKLTLPDTFSKDEIEQVLPATPGQEALLALMLQSDFKDYYNHDLLKLAHDTDSTQLRQAWQTVVDNTAILRTSFMQVSHPDIGCAFAQLVHCKKQLDIKEVQVRDLNQIDDLMEKIRIDVATTLETQSPLRLTVVRSPSDVYLLLSLSHAQYDGHSLALLHADVAHAYKAAYQSRPGPDLVINEALLAASNQSKDFWADMLLGARSTAFPMLHQEGQADTVNRHELLSSVSPSDAREFCRKLGVSLQTLAQTCWALVLAQYTRQLEVVFGAVLACRDSDEAEDVVFPTMNTVPVRATLFGSRSQMLSAVQEYNTEILQYKQTPLRLINSIQRQGQEHHERTEDLFKTLFIYQQRPSSTVLSQKPLYESMMSSSSVDYPVAAEMELSESSVLMRAAVKDKILSLSQTKTLVDRLDLVLRSIIAQPESSTVELAESDTATICGLPSFKLDEPGVSQAETAVDVHAVTDMSASHEDIASVVDVLAQVSGVSRDDIEPSSALESLGIDSISAIKVSSLLKKIGRTVKVSDLIKSKRVDKIAALVGTSTEKQKNGDSPVRDAPSSLLNQDELRDKTLQHNVGIAQVLPATAGQVYMISVWNRTQGRLFYPTFAYSVNGTTDRAHIEEAWRALVMKHAILRTVFATTINKHYPLAQVVLKEMSGVLFNSNYSLQHDHHQPFVRLEIRKQSTRWSLELTIHHALYDAVSLELIAEDLQTLLNGGQIKQPFVSLHDYIQASMGKDERSSRRAFWTDYLGNASLSYLKPAQGKGRVEIFRPDVIHDAVTLEKSARKNALSLQAVIFAAWAKVYAAYSAGDQDQAHDVVLGVYLSNRSHLDGLLQVRAPTLNLLPVLVRQPRKKSLKQLAQELQNDLAEIGTAERSSVALWEIHQWTGIAVDTFLNFIKLPEQDDKVEKSQRITVLSAGQDKERARSQVVAVETKPHKLPSALQHLPQWTDAYKDTLDIEMTVAHGSLDIGVFALESIIQLHDAEGMLMMLEQELRSGLE